MSLFKKNFVFNAFRYEEWQDGRCLSQGQIDTTIIAEVYDGVIHFELDDVGGLRIQKRFSFTANEPSIDLVGRLQYIHATSDMNPIVPIVCHVFKKGEDDIEYVRFAMTNPDRIIEFYGTMTELGQKSRREVVQEPIAVDASRILDELDDYGMLNEDAIFEKALGIYRANSEPHTVLELSNLVEALRLFVRADELDLESMEEDEDEFEDEDEEYEEEIPKEKYSFFRPKILLYIALCNLHIGNFNQAYYVARKGLSALDDVLMFSPFQGLDPNMFGKDDLEGIVRMIEENQGDKINEDDDEESIDETEIDLKNYRRLKLMLQNAESGPGDEEKVLIRKLIVMVDKTQSNAWDSVEDLSQRIQLHEIFEIFKSALFFCWEKLGHGHHSDFWEEGDSMMGYMMFEIDAKNKLKLLLQSLSDAPLFASPAANKALTSIFKKTLNTL